MKRADDVRQLRPNHLTPISGVRPILHPPPSNGIEPELLVVRLVADEDDELDSSTIEREFPTVTVQRASSAEPGDLVIDDFAWRGAFDFSRFDELVEQGCPVRAISVRGFDAAGVATEVIARYQRLVARRNEASNAPIFDAVLDAHAALFDASLNHDQQHALDTWQWMLRLQPNVGLAPQVAALFHDVDRLQTDANERLEHRAHRALDEVQEDRGRGRVLALLQSVGLGESNTALVRALISGEAKGTPEGALLDDADALSFLSLMSPRYADHFGLAQTRRKVTFTLGRLGELAREKVATFRLRPDVDRLLRQS
jgi:hypothetical protein